MSNSGEGDTIVLPPAVCDRIKSGSAAGVSIAATSPTCMLKTDAFPACGPWSSAGKAPPLPGTVLPVSLVANQAHPVALEVAGSSVYWTNRGDFDTATGAVVSTFVQVASAASCGPASTGHFYYDDNLAPTKLILCPATCAAVRPNIGFAVKLTLSCPGTYTDWEHSEIYSGVCPLGSRVSWGFLTFDTSEPPSTSTTFLVRTAPEIIDLPATPLRKLITAAPGVPDTQKCSMAGPAPCPIDLFSALGGPPAARHEQLELVLDMHTNVSHSRSPTINSWQITYACPPDE